MRRRHFLLSGLGLGVGLLAACSGVAPDPREESGREESGDDAPTRAPEPPAADDPTTGGEQEFPDVLEAELAPSGDEWMIAVTISSPYDTPERYADGWRVMTPDGEVLAEHDLAHDHANEQPFTRRRGPFTIPREVTEVEVEGRDRAHGYGGRSVTVTVPR